MHDWRTEPLERIAEISTSNVDKKSNPGEKAVRLCNYMDVYSREYITADIEFMEATATTAEIQRFEIECGDVMITKDSETPDDIGIPAVVVDDIPNLVCGYHVALIKPRLAEIDPIYLAKRLALTETARYYGRVANGSTRYGLTYRAIAQTPIQLAPLPQQKRIAEILSTVDEAIEETETLIAKTQQIKAGLMHDLFTRGVTADGELRPPREEAPHLYKESPLGWIPKEWELRTARELCSVITKGTTPPEAAFRCEDRIVRFLRVDNLSFDGELDLTVSSLFVDPCVHHDMLSRSIVRPGDVLTNIVGPPLGKVAIVPEAENEWNANQAIAIFRAAHISAEFLKSWLLTSQAQRWLAREAKQTSGQVNLTLKMCGDLPVPLPQSDEQACLISHLAAVTENLSAEEDLLSKLRKQKHGLADDLLVGRVAVSKEASTSVAEATASV